MEQKSFFRAIEEQSIEIVQEMLGKGVKVNDLSPHGTVLYRSVKLHNFELTKLLVENGADCNIGQLDFDMHEKHLNDGLEHFCFISTPIDLLCINNEVINDELLKYLLENRFMVTEDMINQRIRYCTQLFDDDENNETLFDYAASYLLRKNMYDHLWPIGDNALLTMITAILNIDARLPNESNEPLTDGGTHQAFFTLLIRSLFEELVRYRLHKSCHIVSEQQYALILRELLHNLEAYNLLMDINFIPHERKELFYPSMIKNIINKLKNIKNKDEYTVPIKWRGQSHGHALCLNFVRESNSIAIRMDNLNSGEMSEHSTYKKEGGFLVMIPKIIGAIPIDKLDHNEDYFKSLLMIMKETPNRTFGIKTLYHNNKLKYLDTSRVSMLTDQLEEQSRTLNFFVQQAESNCFVKSHEPGFMIRSNDYNISQKMITVMGNYAMKLRTIDVTQKRNELERALRHYWEKETTITTGFEAIRQQYKQYRIERIMNTSNSFPIDRSYINLAIVDTKEQQEKEKKLDGAKHSNAIISTFEEIYGTKTVIEVKDIFEKCKDQTKKILVFGRAGIGKTTFCRYVAYQWAADTIWTQYPLVILIPLRRLIESRYPSGKKYSLIDLVKEEYSLHDALSEQDERLFKEQCRKGEVLWLLDGYDEFAQNIPEQLKDLFEKIRTTQHHILTSRPYGNTLSYAVQMEITGFTDDNIRDYVKQFFDQIQDKLHDATAASEKLLGFLELNPSIWGVAHIPVNLELICTVWCDTNWSETTALTITRLYDKMVEWLCRRYLAKRGIETQMKTKDKVYKQCANVLACLEMLAFEAMENNIIILPPSLLENISCETEFSHLLEMGLLKSLDCKLTSTPIEAYKDHYFIHLSFQEHFAARHLVNTLKGVASDAAINFIKRHKYDHRFSLMLNFASGLLTENRKAQCLDIFWNTILGDPLDHIGMRHMQIVVSCFEESFNNNTFERRSELIHYVVNCIKCAVTSEQYIILLSLRYSFRRCVSIVNAPEIIQVFQSLLQIHDTLTRMKVIGLLEVLPIRNSTTEPIHSLVATRYYESWDTARLVSLVLAQMGEKAESPDVIGALIIALKDNYWELRKSACRVLCKMGEKAATPDVIGALILALKDSNGCVRESACDALGEIGEKAATPDVIKALTTALKDSDGGVRQSACHALGKIGEKAATPDVIKALTTVLLDADCHVSDLACDMLCKMGEKEASPYRIQVLTTALKDSDGCVRQSACHALGQMGEKAATPDVIKALTTVLLDADCHVSDLAYDVLCKMGEKAATPYRIQVLTTALKDSDGCVRQSACHALGQMGEKAATPDVIQVLTTVLKDSDRGVRESACRALGKIGEKAATPDVIKALTTVLLDADCHVSDLAYDVLCKMGEKAATPYRIQVLTTALKDSDGCVRQSACHALGQMGEKAATPDVIQVLTTVLKDSDRGVRESACRALGKIGEKAATPDVIKALTTVLLDADCHVSDLACDVLCKMGEKVATPDVIQVLTTALKDSDGGVRQAACHALGKIGEKAATPDVIKALTTVLLDADCHVSDLACDVLCKMGEKVATPDVIQVLTTALKDSDGGVRQSACRALGKIGEKAATPDVIKALIDALKDSYGDLRGSVCRALGNMGEKAATPDVIQVLTIALKDSDCGVRESACRALGKMGEKAATPNMIEVLATELGDVDVNVRCNAYNTLCIMGNKAATNAVINGLLHYEHRTSWSEHKYQGLYSVLASSASLSYLDLDTVSKLSVFQNQSSAQDLFCLPLDKCIRAYFDTQITEWCSLIMLYGLKTGSGITVSENTMVLYGEGKPMALSIPNSALRDELVRRFATELDSLCLSGRRGGPSCDKRHVISSTTVIE